MAAKSLTNLLHTFYLRVRKSIETRREIFCRYDTGRSGNKKKFQLKQKSKTLKDARNVDKFLQINNLTYHLAAEWSSISLCQSCSPFSCSALPLSIHFDLCLLSSTFRFTISCPGCRFRKIANKKQWLVVWIRCQDRRGQGKRKETKQQKRKRNEMGRLRIADKWGWRGEQL